MSVELNGTSAVVTGGSRGIGLATARALAQAGVRVLIIARDAATLENAAHGIGADMLRADVSDPASPDRIAAEAQRLFEDGPDILVNAAGAFSLAAVADTSLGALDAALAANLRAPFALARALLPGMLSRQRGHIVTIGSVAGRHAFPANGAYAASKFGVRGMHAVLDAELRGTGVRSTLIEPAATDTSLWDSIDLAVTPGLPARSSMLSPSAVADAVLYAITRPHDVAVRNIILERA